MSESGTDNQTVTSSRKLEALESRFEALSQAFEDVEDAQFDAEEERQELRREIETLRSENDELRSEIERLDARTDMLKVVQQSDNLDGRQRSLTLIQHLKKACENRADDAKARAAVDRSEAESALHYPDVDRTTIYSDMERAARLVGAGDVLSYTDGELRMRLDQGDIPRGLLVELNGGD